MLKQIQYDYERQQYNTIVSGAMKLLNALEAAAQKQAPTAVADAAALEREAQLRSLRPKHLIHASGRQKVAPPALQRLLIGLLQARLHGFVQGTEALGQ